MCLCSPCCLLSTGITQWSWASTSPCSSACPLMWNGRWVCLKTSAKSDLVCTVLYEGLCLTHIYPSPVWEQDFKEQVIHHTATLTLLSFSWISNYIRVGTIVMAIHDCSDIVLEVSARDTRHKTSRLRTHSDHSFPSGTTMEQPDNSTMQPSVDSLLLKHWCFGCICIITILISGFISRLQWSSITQLQIMFFKGLYWQVA